jgi:regulatory protein
VLKLRLVRASAFVYWETEWRAMAIAYPEQGRRITDLRPVRGHGQRVSVYVDGRFALSVGADVALREGLRKEQVITDESLQTLAISDQHERCLAAATRYLAFRPRSRAELEERLRRRGFDGKTRATVLERLQVQGLLNDAAFARFWADSREASSPRSRRLTRVELQKKGVSREIADETVNAIDDDASAYRAALGRAGSLRRSDREEFRRRLGAYLQRRGFSYEVVRKTVERVWKIQESSSGNSEIRYSDSPAKGDSQP